MSGEHNPSDNTSNLGLDVGPASPESVGFTLSTSFERLRVNNVAEESDQTESPFLHLPPEIRLVIYQVALVDNGGGISILETCQQIKMEAHELLYHRSSTFNSQAKLFAWIERSRIANLNRVRRMTLRLTDVDLTTLLESPNSRHTRTTVWSLYKDDLQRLEQSLSAVPSLTSLTIVPPKIGNSHLLKNMYQSFLSAIPRRCPKLKRLEIYDSDTLLETVPALKAIPQVTFNASRSGASVESTEDRRGARMGGNAGSEQTKEGPH